MSSFAAIRNAAYSAMSASQVKTQIAAANIANADTKGYTVKSAVQVTTISGSVGTGVSITAITSTVDKYLLKDIAAASSEHEAAVVTDNYANSLQNIYGSTTGGDDTGTSLAQSVADLEAALVELAATPDSQTLKSEMVASLSALTTDLQETLAGVQGLREDTDNQIADVVGTVNTALETIKELNDQITSAKSRGQSTADLEDQRNMALQTVAEQIDINYYVNNDGAMQVSTGSGTMLVGSTAHLLSYSSAPLVTSETSFDAILVDGKNITAEIKSGAIGALVTMRDETLVAAQDELDALASGLIETFNAIYSTSTTIPAPSSITSTTQVDTGDTLSATGTLRLAVTESDGAAVSVADLDLASYSTMGELVTAIDSIGGFSANIDSSGYLTISADNSDYGIAVGEDGVSVDAEGAGLADYLGLNDLLVGTNASTIAVRSDILEEPNLLATSSVSSEATLTAGDSALTSTDTLAVALKTALAEGYEFDAAGSLSAGTQSFSDYATDMVTGIATGAATAATMLTEQETSLQVLTDLMASQTGVNLDEETARLTELEQYYAVATQVISALNSMFDALLAAARTA